MCDNLHSAARWPQPKRTSPCSPTLQSLNTETTEDLSDLCVKFFLATEDTEALLVREEIFAPGEDADCKCYRALFLILSDGNFHHLRQPHL